MRILAIISGEYGRRHVANIREHGPAEWTVEVWPAVVTIPLMLDDPLDYVPATLPPADLILCRASMSIDTDYGDTLMHESGNFIKDDVGEQVKPFKRIQYIAPGVQSE